MKFQIGTICFFVILGSLSCYAQIGGSVSTAPGGGHQANVVAGHAIGTPNHNLGGKIFASGPTNGGPVSTGGALNYNHNNLGASLSKTHTPGFGSTTTGSGSIGLINNPSHQLGATAFQSHTKLDNGFNYNTHGGALNYHNPPNGIGGSVGASRTPGFGTNYNVGVDKNIWRSQDGATSVDAYGLASKTLGGPQHGRSNYGFGIGTTHRF